MTLTIGEPCPWVLGGRDNATCQRLLDPIGLSGKHFITDDWPGYPRLIPASCTIDDR